MRGINTTRQHLGTQPDFQAPENVIPDLDPVTKGTYHSPAFEEASEPPDEPAEHQDPNTAPKVTSPATPPVHRNRNLISALVGIVGFFAVWGYATFLGSGGEILDVFLDFPAAVLVVLTPVTILFAVYGWAGIIDAFAWVFRKPTPGKTAEDAVTFFQLGAAFALASGFLATVIGLVIMLRCMDDVSRIGPGMAIALLSQLYGVFIAVVCIALAAHIARRHSGRKSAGSLAHRSAGIAGITTIAGTLTAMITFGILMLSLAPNW
ncbi:MAG: MotA/TolQ/ExbB proton channel family protein [Phycisphaerae bacterium]|nr:MotA/TolQ/ExbB proton channel family protein [Phycisphaerae bacterium]